MTCFPGVCALLVVTAGYSLASVLSDEFRSANVQTFVFAAALMSVTVLALAMNGRMVFCLIAMVAALRVCQYSNRLRDYPLGISGWLFVALLCASVTSGVFLTMCVGLVLVCGVVAIRSFRADGSSALVVILPVLGVGLLFTPALYTMFLSNRFF